MNKYIGGNLNILVLAQFIKLQLTAHKASISGKFIGEYNIPHNIRKYQSNIYQKEWMGLKNENGIFLLNPTEFGGFAVKQGETINISVGRFDLLGIQ